MSAFVEVKVSELSGIALDWAVGTAEGLTLLIEPPMYGTGYRVFMERGLHSVRYLPTKYWLQGGALIEKHLVTLCEPTMMLSGLWEAFIGAHGIVDSAGKADIEGRHESFGATSLEAVCRVVVASKLGDIVRVPAELVGGAQ